MNLTHHKNFASPFLLLEWQMTQRRSQWIRQHNFSSPWTPHKSVALSKTGRMSWISFPGLLAWRISELFTLEEWEREGTSCKLIPLWNIAFIRTRWQFLPKMSCASHGLVSSTHNTSVLRYNPRTKYVITLIVSSLYAFFSPNIKQIVERNDNELGLWIE